MPRLAPMACAAVLWLGCASKQSEGLGNVGTQGSASAITEPGVYAPIRPAELKLIGARGRLLHAMERTLVLANEARELAGDAGTSAVLPVVNVDAGQKSGEVVFVRWRGKYAKAEPLDPGRAEAWLRVSVLLNPDRVLKTESISGKLARGSQLHHRVGALVSSRGRARELAPREVFSTHVLLERWATGKKRKPTELRAHLYLFSNERGGRDLEMFAAAPRRRRLPEIANVVTTHERGGVGESSVATPLAEPGPMSVARVMESGTDMSVKARGRVEWLISRTGRISRPST